MIHYVVLIRGTHTYIVSNEFSSFSEANNELMKLKKYFKNEELKIESYNLNSIEMLIRSKI